MKKNHPPASRRALPGFTIIQVVVSIVILTTVLSATISLVGSVISQITLNKNRVTALYLAQECLELTRNVRDTAWQQNYPWDCAYGDEYEILDKFIIQPFPILSFPSNPPNCQTDFGVKVQKMTSPDQAQLYIDFSGGNSSFGFSHTDNDGVTATPFRRWVEVSQVEEEKDQMTLSCMVTWEDQSVRLSHILSDWKQ